MYRQGNTGFSLLSFGAVPDAMREKLPFPWHVLPSLDKDEDIAAAYAAADAFLLTPREENFPSVALESLAVGTPVIGFATGGIPEIVEDGVSGYLCNTGDVEALIKNIRTLLDLSEQDMHALRSRCRERATHFSEERCAARYQRLYESILNKRKISAKPILKSQYPTVNLVSYEETTSWILGKFACKLQEGIGKQGISCEISSSAAMPALISHHIPYLGWHDTDQTLIRTIMITHVDTEAKMTQIKRELALADMGVCMSRETVGKLIRAGLPQEKLCFIHPAHDGDARPRKIRLGITSRLYMDARKRENMLVDVLRELPPQAFSLMIMGSGWEKQIEDLRRHGVSVEHYPVFDRERYLSLFESMDYYLYMGMDEGSMGFLDAQAAGVPSIVTAQGYHLDVTDGPTYSFCTQKELLGILSGLAESKEKLQCSVAAWTWENYAKAHIVMWQYLLERRSGRFQKKFMHALQNSTAGARQARALVAKGHASAEAWLATAHALHNDRVFAEADHAMRGYLVRNPDDEESRHQYESWIFFSYHDAFIASIKNNGE